MFRAVFIEDGIGVVDVNQNFSATGAFRELLEQTVSTGQRQMADFASCSFATAGLD